MGGSGDVSTASRNATTRTLEFFLGSENVTRAVSGVSRVYVCGRRVSGVSRVCVGRVCRACFRRVSGISRACVVFRASLGVSGVSRVCVGRVSGISRVRR